MPDLFSAKPARTGKKLMVADRYLAPAKWAAATPAERAEAERAFAEEQRRRSEAMDRTQKEMASRHAS